MEFHWHEWIREWIRDFSNQVTAWISLSECRVFTWSSKSPTKTRSSEDWSATAYFSTIYHAKDRLQREALFHYSRMIKLSMIHGVTEGHYYYQPATFYGKDDWNKKFVSLSLPCIKAEIVELIRRWEALQPPSICAIPNPVKGELT